MAGIVSVSTYRSGMFTGLSIAIVVVLKLLSAGIGFLNVSYTTRRGFLTSIGLNFNNCQFTLSRDGGK